MIAGGDASQVADIVAQHGRFTRWPIVSVLVWIHAAIRPWWQPDPATFIALCGAIAFTAAIILAAWRWPSPALVLIACLPISRAFIAGYVEIYPLAAAVYVPALVWAVTTPARRWKAGTTAVAVASLPLAHVELVVVSVVFLCAFGLAQPRMFPLVCCWSLGLWLAGITILWGPVTQYLLALGNDLNLGDANTQAAQYLGQAWGRTPLLQPAQAWSAAHLGEVAEMLWRIGGVALLVSLCGLSCAKPLPLALACVWLVFAVFAIPKLGLSRDADMFWMVPMTAATTWGRARGVQ